ncbi:MAG: hypothetical protein U5L11_01665 [Arhodomonas sp.]|nr:hypothetical protein [Arhodomonas sp.]
MRETSGRMEEIPGEEAYPAYLDSAIRSVYERAGVIRNNAGDDGSLTMIGTVSPAGGNFEEPVTQATLNTVKAFLGLSADRAYKRFYPAVDPLQSWSRYRAELADHIAEHLGQGWPARIEELLQLLHDGDDVAQMMQVTGEEGITIERLPHLPEGVFPGSRLPPAGRLRRSRRLHPTGAPAPQPGAGLPTGRRQLRLRGQGAHPRLFHRPRPGDDEPELLAHGLGEYRHYLDDIRRLAQEAGVEIDVTARTATGSGQGRRQERAREGPRAPAYRDVFTASPAGAPAPTPDLGTTTTPAAFD